jgi:hypothetical protein
MSFDVGTIEGRVKLSYDSKGLTSLDKDMRQAEGSMGKLEKRSSALGSKLKSGLKVGAVAAGTAIGAGLAVSLKNAITEAREAEKVTRQTEAVIKSTGGAAKVTAKDLEELSTAISNKTGIDDEAIQSAGNLLLTFKDIRNEAGKGNDIFDQTTQAVVDMSAAMGQDFKASSIQLGKALNDPIKGLSALSRVGIQFTEQQKAQIEKMVESGDKMKAQKVILKELESQFGGSAEAQADPIQRLQMVWNNFLEDIGGKLLPILNRGVTALSKFITEVQKGTGAGGEFRGFLEDLWKIARNLWPTLRAIGSAVVRVVKGFAGLPAPVQGTILGLGALLGLGTKIFGMAKVFGTLFKAAKALFGFLRLAPVMMGPVGIGLAVLVTAAVLIIKNWDKVKGFLGGVWNWIKKAFSNVADFVVKAAKRGFLGPIPWIVSNWKRIIDFFRDVPGRIARVLSGVGRFILRPFQWAYEKIKAVIDKIVGVFQGAIDAVKNIAGGIGGAVGKVGSVIGLSEGGRVGPDSGGPQLFVAGEGGKDEWVISQEGNRQANRRYLMEAASALGIPMYAKGGRVKGKRSERLNRSISNLQAEMDLKRRAFEISGGEITPSEFGTLIAMNRKIERELLKLVKASKGTAKREARRALRSAQLDRREMEAERLGIQSDSYGATPGIDDQLAALETELALAEGGYGGDAEEIRAKMKSKLEAKLQILRDRLSKTSNRTQISLLQEAIQSTLGELSGLGSGSSSSGASFIEQLGRASELRYQAFSSFGSNALQMGLGQGGRTLAKGPGGTTVVLNGEFKLDASDPHSSVRNLSYQLANNLA